MVGDRPGRGEKGEEKKAGWSSGVVPGPASPLSRFAHSITHSRPSVPPHLPELPILSLSLSFSRGGRHTLLDLSLSFFLSFLPRVATFAACNCGGVW